AGGVGSVTGGSDAAAIFVGPDRRAGSPAGGQEALQRGPRRFRLEVFRGAAGVEFGRIDRAQPHSGVDLEAGPDAHTRLERVAVDDTQYFGRVDGLRIEFGKSVAGP